MEHESEAPLRVGVIVGSVRPGRRAGAVAGWVLTTVRQRTDVEAALVDLADHRLPVLDEPQPAALGRYENPHTRSWSDVVAGFDAYVIVTPEYNRSIPGPLKNAIDFLYAEWHDKAAGFVSYGIDAGGARAVEHLRSVMGELQVADVRTHVALSLRADFDGDRFAPQPWRTDEVGRMLDQLVAWGRAMRDVRARKRVAARG